MPPKKKSVVLTPAASVGSRRSTRSTKVTSPVVKSLRTVGIVAGSAKKSAKGGSDKKGGHEGDAPDIATAESCSRPSRNALGSKAAMDLNDQSTVVQQKTRRRGTRNEDKGSKMVRREKTNPGTTDDSDWSDVETDRSSVSPTSNSNHRQPLDVVPTAVDHLPRQGANSRRRLSVNRAAQRTYLHNNNNTLTFDAMIRYAAEPKDQPLNFGRVIAGEGRRRSQWGQPTTCRGLRMYTVVVNRRRQRTTSTDHRRTTAEIVSTDVCNLPNRLRQSTDIYRRNSTDLPT